MGFIANKPIIIKINHGKLGFLIDDVLLLCLTCSIFKCHCQNTDNYMNAHCTCEIFDR